MGAGFPWYCVGYWFASCDFLVCWVLIGLGSLFLWYACFAFATCVICTLCFVTLLFSVGFGWLLRLFVWFTWFVVCELLWLFGSLFDLLISLMFGFCCLMWFIL